MRLSQISSTNNNQSKPAFGKVTVIKDTIFNQVRASINVCGATHRGIDKFISNIEKMSGDDLVLRFKDVKLKLKTSEPKLEFDNVEGYEISGVFEHKNKTSEFKGVVPFVERNVATKYPTLFKHIDKQATKRQPDALILSNLTSKISEAASKFSAEFKDIKIVCDKYYARTVNQLLQLGVSLEKISELFNKLHKELKKDVTIKFNNPKIISKNSGKAKQETILGIKIKGSISNNQGKSNFETTLSPTVKIDENCHAKSKTKDLADCITEYKAKSKYIKEVTEEPTSQLTATILNAAKDLH